MKSALLNSVFDAVPERYDAMRQCWLNARRESYITDKITSYALPELAAVLEIGSGTGLLLRNLANEFPHLSFTGLEPIPLYVEYATRKAVQGNLQFVCGAAEKAFEMVSGPFDLILSNDVLHHVGSLEEALSAVTSSSKQGARWLIIEPNVKNLYAFLGQSFKAGERNFWPKQFLELAAPHGWICQQRDYLFLIPPFVKRPADWLQRMERRLEHFPFLAGGVVLELVLG